MTALTPPPHFPRPELATQLTKAVMGMDPFSDAPNGLFLAAPRRTGKSVFLQKDLRPSLQAAGVIVVYVDLWANKEKDPSIVIAHAIGSELLKHFGVVARVAQAIGLESVSIAGVLKLDTKSIGQPNGMTLSDALGLLIEKSGKSVALIIDEAQHSLTSKSGESTMAALKSARDTINNSDGSRLMLIMSGSDRDKLLRLVNTTAAAFYGSHIQRMPSLGTDYVAHIVQQIEASYPTLSPISAAKLEEAFALLGYRPQFLKGAIGSGLNPLESTNMRFEDAVYAFAQEQLAADRRQMTADFLGLKDLERFVIWRLLELGEKFRPYDADALDFYSEKIGQQVTPQQVQTTLSSLRAREPSLIWKSERGDYALDNTQMRDWYLELLAQQAWPPGTGVSIQEEQEEPITRADRDR